MVDDIEDVLFCAFCGAVVLIAGGDDLFANLDHCDDVGCDGDGFHGRYTDSRRSSKSRREQESSGLGIVTRQRGDAEVFTASAGLCKRSRPLLLNLNSTLTIMLIALR